MISKCQTVTVSKKKFSDFEYISESDGVYLVGYTTETDPSGETYTYNIRIKASDIAKRAEPEVIEVLNPCGGESYYVDVIADTESVNKSVFVFDTANYGTFIQLDSIAGCLDSKGYLHIAISKNTEPGTVVNLVIQSFESGDPDKPFQGIYLHSICAAAAGDSYQNLIYTRDSDKEKPALCITLLEPAPIGNRVAETICLNVAVNMADAAGTKTIEDLPKSDKPDYYTPVNS